MFGEEITVTIKPKDQYGNWVGPYEMKHTADITFTIEMTDDSRDLTMETKCT